jgi:pilus assembly protein CpaF
MQLKVSVRSERSGNAEHLIDATNAFLIGRTPDCAVLLSGDTVSRRHACVEVLGDAMRISDSSTNGTRAGSLLLHNENRTVPLETPLNVGEYEIQLARLENIVAEVERKSPPSEYPAPARRRTIANTRNHADVINVEQASVHPGPAYFSPELRREIHARLLEHLDLAGTEAARLEDPGFRPRVLLALRRIVAALGERGPKGAQVEQLIGEMADEALGLGPLEQLLADPEITEIMVVDPQTVYVERGGRIVLSGARFTDDARVRAVIERIVTPLGRRIDESSPLVDARLRDGSRVNAIIKPLALRGSCITIRKFSRAPLDFERLVELQTLDERMARFLRRAVIAKKNIVVSGGTGSGKTTLLNVLSSAIPSEDRIVTIEDSAELRLVQPHVVALETRPPNMENKGEYTIRDLVRNALRMRPDRIIVGECRGGEALDMLQAMNTGHEGSLTTTHANTPREAVRRLETLAMMSGIDLPERAIREQLATSIHLVVQQARLSDGSRKVTSIAQVSGIDDDGNIALHALFELRRTGTGPSGEVIGHFARTGYLPSFLGELLTQGLIKPGEAFL